MRTGARVVKAHGRIHRSRFRDHHFHEQSPQVSGNAIGRVDLHSVESGNDLPAAARRRRRGPRPHLSASRGRGRGWSRTDYPRNREWTRIDTN